MENMQSVKLKAWKNPGIGDGIELITRFWFQRGFDSTFTATDSKHERNLQSSFNLWKPVIKKKQDANLFSFDDIEGDFGAFVAAISGESPVEPMIWSCP